LTASPPFLFVATFELNGEPLRVDEVLLEAFRAAIDRPTLPLDRISTRLWLDLYLMERLHRISPFHVLDEIAALEARDGRTATKREAAFAGRSLRGFWHKHFFSANFVLQNIKAEFGKSGLERLIKEVLDPAVSSVVTQDMIDKLAHRATAGAFENRVARDAITGEWIVYLPTDRGNIYLCCASHADGDDQIRERIAEICGREFKEVADALARQSQ